MRSGRPAAACGLALVASMAAGCVSAPPLSPSSPPAPVSEPAPSAQPPKPANLNLTGFPVAFREGYAAACDGKRREETRYKADVNYKMGWDDGNSVCAKRK